MGEKEKERENPKEFLYPNTDGPTRPGIHVTGYGEMDQTRRQDRRQRINDMAVDVRSTSKNPKLHAFRT